MMPLVLLQIIEAVVSVVACLDGERQASTSQRMLMPVLQALQHQLQQLQQQQPQQANGSTASQSSEGLEVVSTLMDRLGILFRYMSCLPYTVNMGPLLHC